MELNCRGINNIKANEINSCNHVETLRCNFSDSRNFPPSNVSSFGYVVPVVPVAN